MNTKMNNPTRMYFVSIPVPKKDDITVIKVTPREAILLLLAFSSHQRVRLLVRRCNP